MDYIKEIRIIKQKLNELEDSILNEPDWATELNLMNNQKDNYESSKSFSQLLTDINKNTISDSKATSLYMDGHTYRRLDDLSSYIEILTANHNRFNPDMKTKEEIEEFKELTKSFKTRFLTIAVNLAIDKWESENGGIPVVSKVRYPTGKDKGDYHRSYMWKENGEYYGLTLDKRSNEIEITATTNNIYDIQTRFKGIRKGFKRRTKEEIFEWFEEKKRLAEK